jgi:hypothetical protein
MVKRLAKACALAVALHAPTVFAGSGWVNVTVSEVGFWQDNGGEYFVSIDRIINTEGCAQNVAQLRVGVNTVGASGLYSTLLATVSSGRPVMVYVYGCTSSGWPQLWGAQMAP